MTDYPQADDELTAHVWNIMSTWHRGVGNKIDRSALTWKIFGYAATTRSANGVRSVLPSYDRRMRDALSRLPVVHDDGYFVPETFEEAESYMNRERSRIRSLAKRQRMLNDWLKHRREPEIRQLELEM